MRLGEGDEVGVSLLDGFRVRLALLVVGERAVEAPVSYLWPTVQSGRRSLVRARCFMVGHLVRPNE